jgi:outer membrane receptor protein involved in Fe transport
MVRLLALSGLMIAVTSPARADAPWGGMVDGGPGRSGGIVRRPFDPDTELKLTGKELAARGATTLADALDLIPEVVVRSMGRGGMQIDLRGARKGWVLVLVDGVPVSDPFYGTFDVSSIPVTDVAEIRVSLSAASPIDGPGGPGGVIEVITQPAAGGRLVKARAHATDAPGAAGAVTGRSPLGAALGVRVSAGGTWAGRDYTMPDGLELDEGARNAHAMLRVEGAALGGRARVGADLWGQRRSFVIPPGDAEDAEVVVVDAEDMARLGLRATGEAGAWLFEARGHASVLRRDSRSFEDATLGAVTRREALTAHREGIAVHADRKLGAATQLLVLGWFDYVGADVAYLDSWETSDSGLASIGAGGETTRGPFKVHAAAGLGWPVAGGGTPWPEGKLSVTYAPVRELEIKTVAARKGRLPTLRERVQAMTELDPEIATYGEAQVVMRPSSWLSVQAGGWLRFVDGLIKFQGNVGDVTIRGLGGAIDVARGRAVSGGARYDFALASSGQLGADPLDFFPRHRADAWVSGRAWRGAGTVRVRYVDEQIDRGMTLPSRLTLDASAFVDVRKDLRATLRCDNVTDERYLLHATGATAIGRTFLVSLEGTWE